MVALIDIPRRRRLQESHARRRFAEVISVTKGNGHGVWEKKAKRRRRNRSRADMGTVMLPLPVRSRVCVRISDRICETHRSSEAHSIILIATHRLFRRSPALFMYLYVRGCCGGADEKKRRHSSRDDV